MRALVKAHPQPGLWLQDVPEPVPGDGEVLIRVLRTGICGTDLHIQAWDGWAEKHVTTPLVVGHEFVGEVVATGADVSDIAVGDLVSGEGHVVCGTCRDCRAGRRHMCAHTDRTCAIRPFAAESGQNPDPFDAVIMASALRCGGPVTIPRRER